MSAYNAQENDYIIDRQTNTVWKINDVNNQIVTARNKRYFKSQFKILSFINNIEDYKILTANPHKNMNANYWWGNKLK